jgi:hypothetical protein
MATIALSIVIPDAQVPRVQDAIRGLYNMPTATNAELIEKLRQETISTVKSLVLRWERQQAVATAENAVYNVDAT